MTDLAATTRLSTINGMLATIGEAPINSLEDTSLVDVAMALSALDEVTRAILVDGWAFNTDEDYPLFPEGFSPFSISVPPNAMVCLPNREFEYITVRGGKLYDTDRRSFNFQGHPEVPCKIIWSLTFEELPEVTRQYIAVRACRLFQSRVTSSPILHQFTVEDERAARWTHQRNNVRVRRRRYLTDSYSVASILAR
jgi:hypothetical protein